MRAAVLLSLLASAAAVRVHGRAVPRRAVLASPALMWPACGAAAADDGLLTPFSDGVFSIAFPKGWSRTLPLPAPFPPPGEIGPRFTAFNLATGALITVVAERATCGGGARADAPGAAPPAALKQFEVDVPCADAGEEVAAAGGWDRLGGAERAGRALLARRDAFLGDTLPLAGPTTFRGAPRVRARDGRLELDATSTFATRPGGSARGSFADDVLVRRVAVASFAVPAAGRERDGALLLLTAWASADAGDWPRRDDGTEAGAVGRDITAALGSFELVRQ